VTPLFWAFFISPSRPPPQSCKYLSHITRWLLLFKFFIWKQKNLLY
jgi:hypothetical protein